ncbi:hypothetical protein KSX_06650 [Ktedonospora formicarum]|uniref:Uncharacterized protein n=1 Tax=Ktedonospora formicarum TaxID=2778364 RepID=A0A8J3HXL0_9CHLR|nr:hypothetical protein KSX_06650 [Ktedonospora formicarum]
MTNMSSRSANSILIPVRQFNVSASMIHVEMKRYPMEITSIIYAMGNFIIRMATIVIGMVQYR